MNAMTDPAATTTKTWAATLDPKVSEVYTSREVLRAAYAKQVINTTNYMFRVSGVDDQELMKLDVSFLTHDLQLKSIWTASVIASS